ncbi:hypothetical protein [Ligaoa zhengdingensis]|uniref:hypothetical protein n=1 Tax=Ligaoa zhengdingensis TaxID=2763658 RepID=UPI0031BA836A
MLKWYKLFPELEKYTSSVKFYAKLEENLEGPDQKGEGLFSEEKLSPLSLAIPLAASPISGLTTAIAAPALALYYEFKDGALGDTGGKLRSLLRMSKARREKTGGTTKKGPASQKTKNGMLKTRGKMWKVLRYSR